MRREDHLDPDDLDRPDWNDLQSNYQLHDIAEAYFRGRIEDVGLQAEQWGIDQRGDDEDLIFDNKMDLRLWEPHPTTVTPPRVPDDYTGEHVVQECYDGNTLVDVEEWQLRGVADVKSKSSSGWMGVFNLRHLVHYTEWADRYDVPVFIYFTLVDMDDESVGDEQFCVPIDVWDGYERYVEHYNRDTNDYIDTTSIVDDCPYVKRTFGADDGNPVVVIADDHRKGMEWFHSTVVP